MDHIGTRSPPPGAFDGVRLSKGASRQRGLADLIAMVGRRPRREDDDRSGDP